VPGAKAQTLDADVVIHGKYVTPTNAGVSRGKR
jgi:hypothetical protein